MLISEGATLSDASVSALTLLKIYVSECPNWSTKSLLRN